MNGKMDAGAYCPGAADYMVAVRHCAMSVQSVCVRQYSAAGLSAVL